MLVVDDDRSVRQFLERALELAGFDARGACDGRDAMRAIDDRLPDVVLLDLDMPVMNGFAVHEALQLDETTRSIPVVTITGIAWEKTLPVAAALYKPVSTEEIVDTVLDVLARHRYAGTSTS